MNAFEQIVKQLDELGIIYKVHTHEEIPTVDIAKEKVDFDIGQCFKTLAFKYEDKFLFVSLLAEDKLKYYKLCSKLNIKRSNLKRANSKELEEKYGYESGGIAPISISDDIVVIFDRKIDEKEIIFCGSGRRNKTLEMDANDIKKMNQTVILDITEDKEKEYEEGRGLK